jgi:hypothetical protein
LLLRRKSFWRDRIDFATSVQFGTQELYIYDLLMQNSRIFSFAKISREKKKKRKKERKKKQSLHLQQKF